MGGRRRGGGGGGWTGGSRVSLGDCEKVGWEVDRKSVV